MFKSTIYNEKVVEFNLLKDELQFKKFTYLILKFVYFVAFSEYMNFT